MRCFEREKEKRRREERGERKERGKREKMKSKTKEGKKKVKCDIKIILKHTAKQYTGTCMCVY